jgi:hypothetical protein
VSKDYASRRSIFFYGVLLAFSFVLQGRKELMLTQREHFFEAQKPALLTTLTGYAAPYFCLMLTM